MSLSVSIKKSFPAFTLDVDIEAGNETIGWLGESGCGKSLTMRCIAGIETPDEGKIVVNGKTFFEREAGKRPAVNLSPQERKTALLFQNYMLFPNLTVAENVAAGIDRKLPKGERNAQVDAELKRFGLDGFGKRYPSQLSGGQQQRVALARMLAAKPDILMLDEPFSALDAHLKGVLEQNLAGLFETFHGTILYVSHDIDEALRFCDRIAVIEKGHVMEVSTGNNLVNNPQSAASIRLSGCKNTTPAHRIDDRRVFLPAWGIEVETDKPAPQNLTYMGVRAFFLERAKEPGRNTYRVRVVRTSDSRFDRSVLLEFLDRTPGSDPVVEQTENEMKYLEQHLFWRVDKLKVPGEKLPVKDEVLLIRIPSDKVYLVSK
ncbi:MAG: ATP-binding cassette domain-containing protein [Eggerthellaceae bacterium]|nr:ATP-binding cassette domain-containing protein [Eggerthellaceae bacterium]